MNKNSKKNKGFTLLESIIYIALFSIVIGGGMVATYQIIESSQASYNHVILQEEANFLFRKIDWALTGSLIATPAVLAQANNLVVTKDIDGTSTQLEFILSANTNNLFLKRGLADPNILNSSNLIVNSISFEQNPEKTIITNISLTTFQNGRVASQNFSMTKYIR